MDILALTIVIAVGIAAEAALLERARGRAEREDTITDRLIAYTRTLRQ
ncbi:MAG: hypothetical protein JXD18_10750 [Anaerolineae bacterium]|nr:hypothetical protein [Anaerolineae bacterium]